MRLLARRTGQSMAEYAIVLTVVVTAIVAMQIYVKRGLQGRVKGVTDTIGGGLLDAGYEKVTSQYEPYYAETHYQTGQSQKMQEKYLGGGSIFRDVQKEEQTREGTAVTGVDMSQDDTWK